MILQLGVYLSVKFRAFGITFGSFAKALSIGLDTTSNKLSFGDGSAPSSGATTLVNERGILLQVWA
jgi:hypothetical protein